MEDLLANSPLEFAKNVRQRHEKCHLKKLSGGHLYVFLAPRSPPTRFLSTPIFPLGLPSVAAVARSSAGHGRVRSSHQGGHHALLRRQHEPRVSGDLPSLLCSPCRHFTLAPRSNMHTALHRRCRRESSIPTGSRSRQSRSSGTLQSNNSRLFGAKQ